MIRLKITHDGDSTERMFEGDSIVVGRSRECDVVLRSVRFLSREHCRISVVEDRCEVEDLSSKNGVQVNDIFYARAIVEIGDEIRLGDASVEILAFGPDEAAEQIRPCLECGYLMPVNVIACPKCSGSVQLKRRSKLNPEHIPGYELKRKIGSGGMGIVFEAVRKADGETTAIKILKPHLARNPSYLVRFVEETRVLTMLRHPNIVEIYGRGAENGLTFIDMELVRGASVRHEIRRAGRLPEVDALRYVWETMLALDFAAKRRVVHGDVKPSNLLLGDKGVVKLCDFGLARFFDFSRSDVHGLSPEASGRKGTAAYAAPERFARDAKPTVPGDIYSMGVSLFQMVTGELPFGTNKMARQRLDRTSVPDPSLFNKDIRPATCMLIERMLRADPAERYQTYREMQDDVALLLS